MLHMQPPSDDKDDVVFMASQVSQIQTLQDALNLASTAHRGVLPSFEITDNKENTPIFHPSVSSQTPTGKKPPKPSSLSQDSIMKAKGRIQKLPPKCSLSDMLFNIQK
jgi:hypothetical protein